MTNFSKKIFYLNKDIFCCKIKNKSVLIDNFYILKLTYIDIDYCSSITSNVIQMIFQRSESKIHTVLSFQIINSACSYIYYCIFKCRFLLFLRSYLASHHLYITNKYVYLFQSYIDHSKLHNLHLSLLSGLNYFEGVSNSRISTFNIVAILPKVAKSG